MIAAPGERMHGRAAIAILALVAHPSCAVASGPERAEGPRPGQTSFFNEGKDLILGVDARASRITGPVEFLPVQVVVLNRRKVEMAVTRESFTLVRPDGVNLPAASPEEFWRDYHRARADARMGQPFLDNVFGRYPGPPFHWAGLDLFPGKHTGIVPRDGLNLRFGDGTFGYIYFRHPEGEGAAPGGYYKLLFQPHGSDQRYVLDFVPYETKKKDVR